MKMALRIAQVLIGLVFLVFGINGFYTFIEPPGPMHEFIKILHTSHYLHVVKALEIIGGILLLANRKVALGLIILGPIVVNILLFHIFLDPTGLPIAAIIFILFWFLIYGHWDRFKPIVEGR